MRIASVLLLVRRNIAYANLMTQIGVLAFHKNASNVYEKLIGAPDARRMAPQQLGAFFQRLLQDTGNRSEPEPLLDRLIPHQYGNYIINSCVVVRPASLVPPRSPSSISPRCHAQLDPPSNMALTSSAPAWWWCAAPSHACPRRH